MPSDAKLVRDRFLAAADLLADQRTAYLAAHCGDDAELRAAVERLLAAHEQPASVLNRPVPEGLGQTQAFNPREQPGAVIAGRYKLLEEIGEGGMGTVWVAEQTEPVRRKVALKLIKAGMDSKSVLARFEAERQALAVMDHPNIAKVLDGGLTDAGRPYFVMEYVKGVPITEYCDATRLSVQERLHLFVQVCQAVQHAHQKGIIHRDLKPSNILVAPYDDLPVPKVIDFGLAKAMHQSLTERTLHTAHETVLGTPLYMSPEQAQLNNIDVDTRSDIYSLGVLLYELLTGTTPLEKQRFKEAAWDEVKRIIREEEPPRPSMRISSTATLPSLAAGRQIEPARLTKLVRGELDWIVMKSLEKDRSRRYETANGFAADIQRYLAGEPVLAAPPHASYLLSKFVRKHRAGLTTAAAIGLLLLAGVAVSTWQAVRATNAVAVARVAEQEALRAQTVARVAEQEALRAQQAETERAEGERLAKLEAVAQTTQAQKRLTQIEKANEILGSIFENLDPKEIAKNERPLQAILVEKLDTAVAQLEGESIGDLLVVAAMQDKFGESLLGLGEPGKALVLLEKARTTRQAKLGLDHPDTLTTVNNLASAYRNAGKLDLALPLHEESLKLQKAKLGPDHPDTLTTMNNLAGAYQEAGKLDLALSLFEETLKFTKTKLGPEHPNTLAGMTNLAMAYLNAGKRNLALALLEETLKLKKAKLGPEHPLTLTCLNNLAWAYRDAGKLDQALPLFEETLNLTKAKLGPEHPSTLTSMNNLASTYWSAKQLDKSIPLFEETLKRQEAKLGRDHPETLRTVANLGVNYRDAGRFAEALPLLEEAFKLGKARLGVDHPHTLSSMRELAVTYKAAGKLDLAVPFYEETLKLTKAKLGPEHPDTLTSMGNLADAYRAAGKLDLALPLSEETLKFRKAKLGPEHPDTLNSMNNLAVAYQDARKLDLALPLYEETLKLTKAKFGPDHPYTLITMKNLGRAYCDANRGEKAAATLKEFVAGQRKRAKPDDPQFAGQLAQVALELLKCRQHAAAEEMLRECLAIREKKEPDDWRTFNTQSLLGGALLGQKKYADAEPLLLVGSEGMKQREATIPEQGKIRLPEALDRLIDLYTATDQPEEVKKWQAERAKYPQPTAPAPAKEADR